MRASYRWLRDLTQIDASASEFGEALTRGGLEVDGFKRFGLGLEGVVIAEVRGRRPHPSRERLSLVSVFDGEQEIEVVCGAPNVPAPEGKVLFAREGSCLPGGNRIEARAIGGVTSRGMICSETELEIGFASEGITVVGELGLQTSPSPGTAVVDALQLEDTAIELSLTPNRPDALGHVGLARELCALFDVPFKVPPVPVPSQSDDRKPSPPIQVSIEHPEKCPRYGAGLVSGVRVAASPFWLRYRLFVLELRSINNVVDVTNYAMLERGHPVHAFDLARIHQHHVVVRTAQAGEHLTTLDGETRSLTADDLLICDPKGPIALAGVMGGQDSEIKASTQDVLVETAYFQPSTVRRTSRRAGLHTDASHRFERGTDPNGVPAQLARTIQLIADVAGGTASRSVVDQVSRAVAPTTLNYRLSRGDRLLGHQVPAATVRKHLTALGCEVSASASDELQVTVPTFRPDISREIDLVEEVGRTVGYNNIEARPPAIRPRADAGKPSLATMKRALRNALVGAGLHEAINYAFVGESALAAARVPTDAVRLLNPLSEERSVLRTSLLPGLAEAMRVAQSHQVSGVKLFELGRIFRPAVGSSGAPLRVAGDETLPSEENQLAFLLSGQRRSWIKDDGAYDFFDGKGVLEHILDRALGARIEFSASEEIAQALPWMHPKRCAQVALFGVPVASVGELHPAVVDDLSLLGRPVFCALSCDELFRWAQDQGRPQAQTPTRFPVVERDLALLVDEHHSAGRLSSAISELGGALIGSVHLFDLYRGDQVPGGKKSLAFRLTFQDRNQTLTDKQVDKLHASIAKGLAQRFSATVR